MQAGDCSDQGKAVLKAIPFNVPHVTGNEQQAIAQVFANGTFQGDGAFTRRCQDWFKEHYGCAAALMTPSCSMALDMAMILSGVGPGDEVLMPDFTFVSTAQSVALRGATPVFCDIRSDTLNIDERRLEEALTSRTRAILPVHYAGVRADMGAIKHFAQRNGLQVIEDAAQGMGAEAGGRPVGIDGAMAAISFHASKNIHCGEGGMLLVNDPALVDAAHIVWEKGTNRHAFLAGKIDKYNWITLGSSFLSNELSAAMLVTQLADLGNVTERRRNLWESYDRAFEPLEREGLMSRPTVPPDVRHNGHIYYVLFPRREVRDHVHSVLKAQGIGTAFHYPPLHSSPGGQRYGKVGMDLAVTKDVTSRLLRMPIYAGMEPDAPEYVVSAVRGALGTVPEVTRS